MNRYSRILSLFNAELSSKTSWGRNEIKIILNKVLNQVADEEIAEARASLLDQQLKRSNLPKL